MQMQEQLCRSLVWSLLVLAIVGLKTGVADNCNNDCRVFDFQKMPSTGCSRYTPTHARESGITWSSDGDSTRVKKTSNDPNDIVDFVLTNITTCASNCPMSTQSYGFSHATGFVINDVDTEVTLHQQFVRKYCKLRGSDDQQEEE
jgi:hypothetical protein